jgi:hypothetical protein
VRLLFGEPKKLTFFQFVPSIVCGQDSKGNKVCADSKSVILPSVVCGQDSKGNKVCANSKREVEARAIAVSALSDLSSCVQR